MEEEEEGSRKRCWKRKHLLISAMFSNTLLAEELQIILLRQQQQLCSIQLRLSLVITEILGRVDISRCMYVCMYIVVVGMYKPSG